MFVRLQITFEDALLVSDLQNQANYKSSTYIIMKDDALNNHFNIQCTFEILLGSPCIWKGNQGISLHKPEY